MLWWSVVAVSAEIPAGGLFAPCGEDCPANPLLVTDSPALSDALMVAFRACGAATLLATAGVLTARLLRATPPTRPILAPVLTASIVRTISVAAYLALGSPALVLGLLLVSYWSIPVSIIVGLGRARAYDAAALEHLVQRLRSRPGPEELEPVLAEAVGDPTLSRTGCRRRRRTQAPTDGR